LVPFCAGTFTLGAGRCCATGGAIGRGAGGAFGEGRGSIVKPRCAVACGPAAAQSATSNIRNNKRKSMCRFRAAEFEQASRKHHASFRQNRQGRRTRGARGLQCGPMAYCSRRASSDAFVAH
jgi:hypothetical protein